MKPKVVFLLSSVLISLSSCELKPAQNNKEEKKDSTPQTQPTYVSGSYSNPLFVTNSAGNFYNNEIADPCVVRGDDGFIYCFATSGRCLRSEDGCEWTSYTENVIPRPSWGDAYAERPIIWAPDVIKIGEKWIYYYSLSAWGGPCGVGYATADEIAGPWTDQGRLFLTGEIDNEYSLGVTNSIDQQVILDGDDVYMVFGSFYGCYLIELTEDGMGLKNGPAYQRQHKVLVAGTPTGWSNHNFEGSWIFKKDDSWYFMGSAGSCCNGKNSTYHVMCGKADNIAGPYLDSQGRRLDGAGQDEAGDLVIHSTSENENTKAPGHNAVIMDDAGDFWWYGHCFYEYDNFATRHLAMDKLEWDENDMPYVEGNELSYNEELDGPKWLEE